jgi:hypothetical protein
MKTGWTRWRTKMKWEEDDGTISGVEEDRLDNEE